MIDPVKIQEDKIRFDYLKKDLTFEEYRKDRKRRNREINILGLVLIFFVLASFWVGLLYSLSSESNILWKKTSVELGEEVCNEMDEEFVNIKIVENPDGTKRATVYCSYRIKMFFLEE